MILHDTSRMSSSRSSLAPSLPPLLHHSFSAFLLYLFLTFLLVMLGWSVTGLLHCTISESLVPAVYQPMQSLGEWVRVMRHIVQCIHAQTEQGAHKHACYVTARGIPQGRANDIVRARMEFLARVQLDSAQHCRACMLVQAWQFLCTYSLASQFASTCAGEKCRRDTCDEPIFHACHASSSCLATCVATHARVRRPPVPLQVVPLCCDGSGHTGRGAARPQYDEH